MGRVTLCRTGTRAPKGCGVRCAERDGSLEPEREHRRCERPELDHRQVGRGSPPVRTPRHDIRSKHGWDLQPGRRVGARSPGMRVAPGQPRIPLSIPAALQGPPAPASPIVNNGRLPGPAPVHREEYACLRSGPRRDRRKPDPADARQMARMHASGT